MFNPYIRKSDCSAVTYFIAKALQILFKKNNDAGAVVRVQGPTITC
jgi:hypothetical protein